MLPFSSSDDYFLKHELLLCINHEMCNNNIMHSYENYNYLFITNYITTATTTLIIPSQSL